MALLLQQLAHEPQGCGSVAVALHEDIEDLLPGLRFLSPREFRRQSA